MKYASIVLMVWVALECFSSSCNGNFTGGSKMPTFQQQDSVDCGSYPIRNRVREIQKHRGKSSVSTRLRSGFASFYKPVYSCMIASNVTEVASTFQGGMIQIAIIQFKVDKSTSNNDITGARLTFSLAFPENLDEDVKYHLSDVRVSGSFSGFHGIPNIIPKLEDEEVPTDTSTQATFNFNAVNLLRNMSWAENKVGNSKIPDNMQNEKVTVNFYVSRNCDNQYIDHCPKMFNTTFHVPSLRVFFV